MAGVNLGFLKFTLGFDSIHFRRGMTAAERDLVKMQKKFAAVGDKLSSIGQSLSLGLTLPLAAFGGKAIKAAADAEEMQSAFNATFGQMAGSMNRWAEETGNALGRSTQEMQKAANTFGMFFNTAASPAKAAAMSQTFAKLAQDLASFHNTDVATAIEKLRAGLSGETEPLRQFGVFLTEAAVKAEGLRMGLWGLGNEFTEQEKILARYQIIMRQTQKAHGDVERTSGSATNRVRAMNAAWEELQVAVGQKLLPAFTPIVRALGDLVNGFNQLPDSMKGAIGTFALVAAAVGPLTWIFGGVVGAVAKSAPAVAKLAEAFGGLRATAAGVGASTMLFSHALLPIAAAVGAIYVAYKNWDKIKPVTDAAAKATEGYFDRVKVRFAEFAAKWEENSNSVETWARQVDAAFARPVPEGKTQSVRKQNDSMTAFLAKLWNSWNEGSRQLQIALNNADQAILRFVIATEQAMLKVRQSVIHMVNGVREWLQDRLGAVFAWVKGAVASVKDAFQWLGDKVVFNSIVPDMVMGIGASFAQLGQVMVQPAMAATGQAADAFEDLSTKIQRTAAETLGAVGEMVAGVITGVKGMVATFKSGDVLSGIQQFLELVLSVVQALGRIGVIKLPGGGVDGARAGGGPVVPGKTYLVGENGPEFITPRRSGYVHPSGSGGMAPVVRIVPSPFFEVVVDGRARHVAAPMAGQAAIGGALGAQQALAKRQRMNLAGR
jgi:hypothetical protein